MRYGNEAVRIRATEVDDPVVVRPRVRGRQLRLFHFHLLRQAQRGKDRGCVQPLLIHQTQAGGGIIGTLGSVKVAEGPGGGDFLIGLADPRHGWPDSP
jgi:hypothetical protein